MQYLCDYKKITGASKNIFALQNNIPMLEAFSLHYFVQTINIG